MLAAAADRGGGGAPLAGGALRVFLLLLAAMGAHATTTGAAVAEAATMTKTVQAEPEPGRIRQVAMVSQLARAACGAGEYKSFGSCAYCAEGKFSAGSDNTACTSCPSDKPNTYGTGSTSNGECYKKLIDCGRPSIAGFDAAKSSGATTEGSTFKVVCAIGYSGSASTVCQKSGSWSPVVKCAKLSCQDPGTVVGTTKIGSKFLYLDSVAYFCMPGRELSKTKAAGALIQCLVSGKWEAKPTCALKDCGSPGTTVANGKIAAAATTFGSTAAVACNSGHQGGGAFKCGADGKWTSPPACFKAGAVVRCSAFKAATGMTGTGSGLVAGSTRIISCASGYASRTKDAQGKVVTAESIACLTTKAWKAATLKCVNVDECQTNNGNCGGGDAKKAACTDSAGSFACKCKAGHFGADSAGAGNKCTLCDAGKIATSISASSCKSCGAGQATNAARTQCAACAAGTSVLNGVCHYCALGQQPDAKQAACTSCTTKGASTFSADGKACVACAQGKEPNVGRTDCTACGLGKFSASGAPCQSTDGGSQPFGRVTSAATKQEKCKTGWYSSPGDLCAICGLGFYTDNGEDCYKSDAGKQPVDSSGNAVSKLAVQQAACPAGTHSAAGELCKVCALGAQPAADQKSCSSCKTAAARTFSKDGKACVPCTKGRQPNAGRTGCDACAIGTYSEDGTPCKAVAAGQQPKAGAKTAATDQELCIIGTYSQGSELCKICAAGNQPVTAGNKAGKTGSRKCAACDGGTNSGDGKACVKCAAGKASNDKKTDCLVCGRGFFTTDGKACVKSDASKQPVNNNKQPVQTLAIAQAACSKGTFSSAGDLCMPCSFGQQPADNQKTCVSCKTKADSTFSKDGKACVACVKGTQPNAGRTGCDACSIGKYSKAGAPCIASPAGKQPVYASGQVARSGGTDVKDCPAGSFTDSSGQICKAVPQNSAPNTNRDAYVCKAGYTKDGAGNCNQCVVGKSKVAAGNGVCASCKANEESNAARTACVVCTATKYAKANVCTDLKQNSQRTKAGDSYECKAGFTKDGAGNCNLCTVGTVKPTAGNAACTDCKLSAEANAVRTTCVLCNPATHYALLQVCTRLPLNSVAKRSGTAFLCLPGFIKDGDACASCPAGTRGLDGVRCLPCLDGSISNSKKTACICQPKFYNATALPAVNCYGDNAGAKNKSSVCLPCPSCMTCSIEEIAVKAGFALSPTSDATKLGSELWIAACPVPTTCMAKVLISSNVSRTAPLPNNVSRGVLLQVGAAADKQCIAGSSGVLCAQCAENFKGGNGAPCVACDASGESSPLDLGITGIFVLIGLVLFVKLHESPDEDMSAAEERKEIIALRKKKNRVMTLVRITVSTFQLVASLPGVLDLQLPAGFARMVSMFSALNLDVFKVLTLGCIEVGFFDKFTAMMLLPLALTVAIVLYFKSRGRGANEMQNSLVLLAFLIYPNLSSKVFQVFSCQALSPSESFHKLDYSMDCSSPEYSFYKTFALVCLAAYPIGIPVSFALMLFKNRVDLFTVPPPDDEEEGAADRSSDQDAEDERVQEVKDNFSFLCGSYEERIFYWELVEYMRKFLLTGALVFVEQGSASQVFVALVISFFYFAGVTVHGPFVSDQADRLKMLGESQLFLTMLCAMMLQMPEDINELINDEALNALLIAINTLFSPLPSLFFIRKELNAHQDKKKAKLEELELEKELEKVENTNL